MRRERRWTYNFCMRKRERKRKTTHGARSLSLSLSLSLSSRIRGLSRENPPRDQRSKSKNLRDLFSISVSLRDLLRASVSVREPFPASSKDFSTFELVLVEKQLLLREYSLASLVVLPPFRLTHSSTLSLTHVVSSLT